MTWANKVFDFFNDKSEKRSSGVAGYAGLNQYLTTWESMNINGGTAIASRTAAVEFALGLVYRAFLCAETSPSVIPPSVLASMAREAMGTGNSVWSMSMTRRGIILLPVYDYEVSGELNPDSWVYAIRQRQPNGEKEDSAVAYGCLLYTSPSPRDS